MDALQAAVIALVDARLAELGLVTGKASTTKSTTKAANDESAITLDALKIVAKKIADQDDLKAVLKKLKAAKLSEIKESDYAKAMELLKNAAGEPDATADDGAVTLDVLKEKFTALVNNKGKDVAKGILKKLKAEQLKDVKEKDYEKAAKLIDEALAVDEDETNKDEEDLFGTGD
jgi:hypothetical protein